MRLITLTLLPLFLCSFLTASPSVTKLEYFELAPRPGHLHALLLDVPVTGQATLTPATLFKPDLLDEFPNIGFAPEINQLRKGRLFASSTHNYTLRLASYEPEWDVILGLPNLKIPELGQLISAWDQRVIPIYLPTKQATTQFDTFTVKSSTLIRSSRTPENHLKDIALSLSQNQKSYDLNFMASTPYLYLYEITQSNSNLFPISDSKQEGYVLTHYKEGPGWNFAFEPGGTNPYYNPNKTGPYEKVLRVIYPKTSSDAKPPELPNFMDYEIGIQFKEPNQVILRYQGLTQTLTLRKPDTPPFYADNKIDTLTFEIDYLGDLDQDEQPDLVLRLGRKGPDSTSFTQAMYLSSLAKDGEIVGLLQVLPGFWTRGF